MSTQIEGYAGHLETTDNTELKSLNNREAETLSLRNDTFAKLRELGYGEGRIVSLDNLLRTRSNEHNPNIESESGQGIITDLLTENGIESAGDLTYLGVNRVARTGIRVIADFDLGPNEISGPLHDYFARMNVFAKDFETVEQQILMAIHSMAEQSELEVKDVSEYVNNIQPSRQVQEPQSREIDGVRVRGGVFQEFQEPEYHYSVIKPISFDDEEIKDLDVARVEEEKTEVVEVVTEKARPIAEWGWKLFYENLPDTISVKKLSSLLSAPEEWVSTQLKLMFQKPDKQTGKYSKDVIENLYDRSTRLLSSEGWMTVRQLAEASGQSQRWVRSRMNESKMRLKWRRDAESGEIDRYFKEDALTYLEEKMAEDDVQPMEDWMHIPRLVNYIGRSRDWILPRLEQYSDKAEGRRHQRGERPSYPVYVADMLKVESDAEYALPSKGDNLTLAEVANALRISQSEATELLAEMGIEKEVRIQQKGRAQEAVDTYSDVIIGYVKDAERQSPAEIELQFVIGSLQSQIAMQRKMKDLAVKASGRNDVIDGSYDRNIEELQQALDVANQRFNDLTNNAYVE